MSRNCATSLYVIIMDYCGMDAQGLWKVNENNLWYTYTIGALINVLILFNNIR